MSKAYGTRDLWLTGLRTEATAFAAAVGQPDALDLPVPSCPNWTVGDLVGHLGRVYAWVDGILRTGSVTRPEQQLASGPATDAPQPARAADLLSGPALVDWWHEQYQRLADLLESLDTDHPAWNWAPQQKRAGFWHRRMALETVLHRWDAQMATGLAGPIDAKLAADGITEALETWLAAGRGIRQGNRRGIVALEATDLDETWFVRLRGTGIALLDTDTVFDEEHNERAVATGSTSDLFLAIWGRVLFDVLEISGDTSLFQGLRIG